MPDANLWIAFVYVITVLWVVYTALGARAAYKNLADARRDRANLMRVVPAINGILMLEAEGAVVDQGHIFFALMADFLTGAISLAVLLIMPPQPTSPNTPVRVVATSSISILLTAGAVALVRLSLLKRKRRVEQLRLLRLSITLPPLVG